MTRAYYNEIEPFAVQWLRNLIDAGHIAPGDVDSRSISDVVPSDLVGYTQCHFFAGVGGWSLALRLAGWEDSRPVWTGSCPCQPFSTAGEGNGFDDERHLWPDWFHLIRVCRPDVIFGEQVENAVKWGWLDLIQDDLEGENYRIAPVVIPAAGVGAPHGRHRLWFVADDNRELRGRQHALLQRNEPGWLTKNIAQVTGRGQIGELDNNNNKGPQGWIVSRYGAYQQSPWAPGLVDWIWCQDQRWRPVEPGTFPLADGVPSRVGLLRGYGNAIVPQVAAEVIRAYMQCRP